MTGSEAIRLVSSLRAITVRKILNNPRETSALLKDVCRWRLEAADDFEVQAIRASGFPLPCNKRNAVREDVIRAFERWTTVAAAAKKLRRARNSVRSALYDMQTNLNYRIEKRKAEGFVGRNKSTAQYEYRVARRLAALLLLLGLGPSLASAQTAAVQTVPAPPTVIQWDHNPAGTQEYFLEIDGTRVSLGIMSVLGPASTPSTAPRPLTVQPTDPWQHFSTPVPTTALSRLGVGSHQLRMINQGPPFVVDGVQQVKESVGPLFTLNVVAVPPQPSEIYNVIITGTLTGTIQVVPK